MLHSDSLVLDCGAQSQRGPIDEIEEGRAGSSCLNEEFSDLIPNGELVIVNVIDGVMDNMDTEYDVLDYQPTPFINISSDLDFGFATIDLEADSPLQIGANHFQEDFDEQLNQCGVENTSVGTEEDFNETGWTIDTPLDSDKTTIIIECDVGVVEANNSEELYLDCSQFAINEQFQNNQHDVPMHSDADYQDLVERTCTLCSQIFEDHGMLLEHSRCFHPVETLTLVDGSTICKCPYCDYSASRTSVKQHIRTHTKEKPFKCSECNRAFSQKAGLMQHFRIHSSVKSFKCKLCTKSFKAPHVLKAHVNEIHEKLRPFMCSVCSHTFGNRTSLRNHMNSHTDTRKFVCKVCNLAFIQSGHLKAHERIHSGVEPYRCTKCLATFKHSGNLTQHMINNHTHQYAHICELCGRGFIAPGQKLKHVAKCPSKNLQQHN